GPIGRVIPPGARRVLPPRFPDPARWATGAGRVDRRRGAGARAPGADRRELRRRAGTGRGPRTVAGASRAGRPDGARPGDERPLRPDAAGSRLGLAGPD